MKAFFDQKTHQKSQLLDVTLNGHRIDYSCLMKPINAHKPPLVFLAGLFENEQDNDKRLAKIAQNHPVITVHLPGLGMSRDDGADLSYRDYAELLSLFLDYMGITTCHLIANTYSTNIVLKMLESNEERIESLIAVAPLIRLRDSVQYLLKENLRLLDAGHMKPFAAQTSLHQITTFSQNNGLAKEILMNHYLKLLESDQLLLAKYRSHVKRLLATAKHESHHPRPIHHCRVCIVAGSSDLIITPGEAFKFHDICSRSTFVLLQECDQLMNQQKNDVLFRLYQRWVEGKSLKRMKDIKVIESNELAHKFIRVTPRLDVGAEVFLMTDHGEKVAVTLERLTPFGCQLSSKSPLPASFAETGKIVFPFKDLVLNLGLFPLNLNQNSYRGIFSHESFESHEKLQSFLFEFSLNNHVKIAG